MPTEEPITAETATDVHWLIVDILKGLIGIDEDNF